MIISYADLTNKLDLIRRGKVKTGYEFGHHRIDDNFVFKQSELNIILGHANVGKTTVVLYLMVLQSLKNNFVWLVYSSENTASSLATKISEFYLGKVLHGATQEELQSAMNFMMQYFVIIDADHQMYTYSNLLEEATDLHVQYEFDGFMIDPYNSLSKDKDMYKELGGHEYDYEVLTHFRNWCIQRKVSIWLCVHAVTEALRKKHPANHEYAGLPIPPSMSDVEGGGKYSNRCNSMLVIHRYVQHPTEWMYSHIHVMKIKEIETGGKPTSRDEPIVLRSLPNNVGFEIDGQNLVKKKETKQSNFPF